MGNRDIARVPVAAVSSKKKRGRQNKNIRNGIFMPPPAGMEARKISDEDYLNVFARKKGTTAGTARSLLGTK